MTFKHKTFVFTGFKDADLKKFIENKGGHVTTKLSAKTTLLIIENPDKSSSKLEKANDLGINVISKDDFISKYYKSYSNKKSVRKSRKLKKSTRKPRKSISKREKDNQVIEELALTYQMIAHLGLDDRTYTHITMRSFDHPGYYYIGRLGPLFSQITSDDILLIQPDGKIANPRNNFTYNISGHFVHKDIYESRPEVNAVIHTHMPNTIAIASIHGGLKFYCQFSYLFFDNISYMSYDAITLDECPEISRSLGENAALLMENHGAITVGKTVYEALFFTTTLEKAAEIQLKIMASNGKPICVPKSVCTLARDQMLDFEEELGKGDWIALKEKILKNDK